MLSVVRREARHVTPYFRACQWTIVNSRKQCLQLPVRFAQVSHSSGGGICHDDLSIYGYQREDSAGCAPEWGAARADIADAALGPGRPGTWTDFRPTEAVFGALAGAKVTATGLLTQWAPPLAVLGALPLVIFERMYTEFLPTSMGEVEEEEEEEEVHQGIGRELSLFEGVWQTSVRRKRVTKMRKHKWRKRRRRDRQSAARRVKN